MHHHQHGRVRRSPRLTLSPPHHPSSGERKHKHKHKQAAQLALTLHDDPASSSDSEPQPLNIYHPKPKSSPLLLRGSSSSSSKSKGLRRSPRLMAESIGVANGKCGSALLLKLPDSSEKKACELARACLGERDFKVRCLRSGTLPVPSHLVATAASASASASPGCSKRKLDSRLDSDDSEKSEVNRGSMRRSPRFSGKELVAGARGKLEDVPLALPSSSMVANLGKCTKLESRKKSENSAEMVVNGGLVRRSPRFSGSSSACKEVIVESRGKSARKLENLPLALPSSPMAENSGKSRDYKKKFENSVKMLTTGESRRRSSRLSGLESIDSSASMGLIAKAGRKSTRKSENVPLALPSPSMAGHSKKSVESPVSGESRRGSSRFSGPETAVETPPCNGSISIIETTPGKKPEEDMIPSPIPMVDDSEEISEEKILRRSPRGLGSKSLVDDYECDEMRELSTSPKKKKKEKKKPALERSEKSKEEEEEEEEEEEGSGSKRENCFFVGDAVPEEEALQKWGWRYQLKNRRVNSRSLTTNAEEDGESILKVKCHYTKAQINGCIFHLGDCALIRGEGRQTHIGRIMEFFETMEGNDYFRVQWFYKAEDTVMKEAAAFHDKKRIFYSTIVNDNLLDCIISKLRVAQVTPKLDLTSNSIPPLDFYYDMEYCLEYSTFRNLPRDNAVKTYELPSLNCPESVLSLASTPMLEDTSLCEPCNLELTMLDLYAGCGAMSTGLCIGARLSGVNLVTRWAIDYDSFACESLRLNHPETQVKNEEAEDFLELLKHWEKLCEKFVVRDGEAPFPFPEEESDGTENNSDAQSDDDVAADELEVSSLLDVCFGDTGESGKRGLKFKVRWKGHGPSEDTWEPIEGLSNCQQLIQDFVTNGFNNKLLPLPGDVDVICGGPPCQGISGYNRFRYVDAPLDDEKNRQLVVFMDIVEYLKPKFVLMENVTDILRFDKASLGRYALSRLVHMNYQARVGIMAAGCYGLPQFRLRVFFWGALPNEELPQFPLPTHDVVVRYWPPPEFERNVVAYEEGQPPELEDAVLLKDAISDLPAVTNYESADEMPYSGPPETEFQKYIRSTPYEMIGSASRAQEAVLYDHRPHQLFKDDYIRVCQIPHRKGANFRDLPGVVVGDDNVVRRDPAKEPVLLPSGMPMAPEYVFTFEQGKSKRPFARLWWDETMATVVTYPNCHSQAVLHPEQDRVLTVRECARLQGFPDNYRFCGTVKKRYRQVGNAVAVPVAKALGYALGMASQKLIDKEPLVTLPPKFAYS